MAGDSCIAACCQGIEEVRRCWALQYERLASSEAQQRVSTEGQKIIAHSAEGEVSSGAK